MRWTCGAAFTLALLIGGTASAAEGKFALLIGNSDYNLDRAVDASKAGAAQSIADGFVPDLPNPANDVADVGAALQRAGYEIKILPNPTLAQMKDGVAWLAQSARAAGDNATAIFYFAGHGVNVSSRDYLVPAGARMPTLPAQPPPPPAASQEEVLRSALAGRLGVMDEATEMALRTEFFAVHDLRSALPDPGTPEPDAVVRGGYPRRVFFFDACRNNAFCQNNGFENFAARRSIVGLIGFFATPVVIFSATPPQVALDGAGRNSVFAASLRRQIARPSQNVVQMFEAVKRDVVAATNGAQVPEALANNPALDGICVVSCPPTPVAGQR
jgi:hypothetical protein